MQLFEIAERVNRLVHKPIQRQTIHAVEADEEAILAFQQSHRSQKKCSACNKAFVNIGRNGKPFAFCDPCHRARRRSQSYQRDPVYNKPPVSRKTGAKCLDCNKEPTRNRNGSFFARCHDCHDKFIQNKFSGRSLQVNAFDDVIGGQAEQIEIDQIEDQVQRSQFLAIDVNAIRKVKRKNRFNPDRYRVKAKVFNKDKSRCLDALLDTGCNTNALSLDACKKLGIDSDIEHKPSLATGVDGHNLKVIGSVDATIHVGKVLYTSSFPVQDKIDGFDVMIGTKFMQSQNLMAKVIDLMKENLGAENVERTN